MHKLYIFLSFISGHTYPFWIPNCSQNMCIDIFRVHHTTFLLNQMTIKCKTYFIDMSKFVYLNPLQLIFYAFFFLMCTCCRGSERNTFSICSMCWTYDRIDKTTCLATVKLVIQQNWKQTRILIQVKPL